MKLIKNKKQYLLIVSVCFIFMFPILISCDNKTKGEKESVNSGDSIKTICEISVIVKDSITINIPNNSINYYHVTYLYNNRYLYGVNLLDPMKIDIIDLLDRKIKKQIKIDSHLFNTNQISNLYVKNEDSIFFLSNAVPAIFLINEDNMLIDKWAGEELKIPVDYDKKLNNLGFGFSTASYLESPYIDSSSGYLYVKLNPISFRDEIGDVDVKRHGILTTPLL